MRSHSQVREEEFIIIKGILNSFPVLCPKMFAILYALAI